MTIKELLKNSGISPSKTIFDRYQHGGYGPPPHGYSFPPPPSYHGPPAPPPTHVFKHYSFSQSSHGGGGKGGTAALSALTLLSFLFFLNILQQCLKDQMMMMSPQVMVMSSSKEQMKREDINEDVKWTKLEQEKQLQKRILNIVEKGETEDINRAKTVSKILSEDNTAVIAMKKSPVFVFAMGDGIGEVYNEDQEI